MSKHARHEHASRVLQSLLQGTHSGFQLYLFALNNPGVELHRIQHRLLAIGGCFEIQRFAADIKGANSTLCRNRVMEIADPWEAYWFATEIDGSSCLQDRVLMAGCSKVAYYFARDILNADVVRLFHYAKGLKMEGLSQEEMQDFLILAKAAHGNKESNVDLVRCLYKNSMDPMAERRQIHASFKKAESLGFVGLDQTQYQNFRQVAEDSLRELFVEV